MVPCQALCLGSDRRVVSVAVNRQLAEICLGVMVRESSVAFQEVTAANVMPRVDIVLVLPALLVTFHLRENVRDDWAWACSICVCIIALPLASNVVLARHGKANCLTTECVTATETMRVGWVHT